jgi:type II secretory pathway pseudopilin PulG
VYHEARRKGMYMQKLQKDQNGFTLLELIIVSVCVIILIALIVLFR